MYVRKSFELNNKIKQYYDKVGYICNHIYRPMVILTEFSEISVNNQDNYMIGVYDCESRDLFKALRSFNLKGIIY